MSAGAEGRATAGAAREADRLRGRAGPPGASAWSTAGRATRRTASRAAAAASAGPTRPKRTPAGWPCAGRRQRTGSGRVATRAAAAHGPGAALPARAVRADPGAQGRSLCPRPRARRHRARTPAHASGGHAQKAAPRGRPRVARRGGASLHVDGADRAGDPVDRSHRGRGGPRPGGEGLRQRAGAGPTHQRQAGARQCSGRRQSPAADRSHRGHAEERPRGEGPRQPRETDRPHRGQAEA